MIKEKAILGIDVGGTSIKYGLVSKSGKISQFQEIPTPKTKMGILNELYRLIETRHDQISKIGLGLPGRLDLKQGKIIKTSNLSLKNVPIVKLIKNRFNLPVKIANDAICFSLAEAIIGAGKKYKYVVGMTLGTGVGGGIIINKQIYFGHGDAGALGHLIIDYKNNKDLEDFLGAKKLKLKPADYRRLENAARTKKTKAVKFFNRLGAFLGFCIINIIRALDPEIIILGGKQSRAFRLFLPQIIKTVHQHSSASLPKIVKSKLIDQAGIIGAALLFKNFK